MITRPSTRPSTRPGTALRRRLTLALGAVAVCATALLSAEPAAAATGWPPVDTGPVCIWPAP